MTVPRFVVAAAIAAVVGAAPAPDDPYEELVSLRAPLAGLWAPASLPTGWEALPCASTSNAARSPWGVLLLCIAPGGGVSVYSATDAASFTLAGLAPPLAAAATLLDAPAGGPWVAIVVPAVGVYTLACEREPTLACVATLVPGAVPPSTVASGVAYASVTAPGAWTVWATGSDTVAWDVRAGAAAAALVGPLGWGAAAIAHSPALGEVTLGNDTKVLHLSDATLATRRWDWVSNVTSGDGGAYDDGVTALAYGDDGTLFVGTPTCLDVRTPSGSVSRVSRRAGLPYGNITSLAVEPPTAARPWARVWIGTTRGAIAYDAGAPRVTGAGAAPWPLRQRWRYFYGPRYLPSAPGDPFGGAVRAVVASTAASGGAHVITPAGLATLRSEQWTLAAKADAYERMREKHTVLGQVNQCTLPSFGVTAPCVAFDDDNNGLWSSLIVGAEAMRYAVTGDAAAQAAAWETFLGMRLLMTATGVNGLIARAVVPVDTPKGGGNWHNSSAFPGLKWKGDASSDEICGHLFAYPLVARLVAGPGQPANASLANATLVDIARYIVVNGYKLIDITGNVTRWGRWDPGALNVLRAAWGDSRGLNSLEILGLLAAGMAATAPASADHALFAAAFDQLAGAHDYTGNMLNLKIIAPSDENASDDELALFAYFGAMWGGALRDASPFNASLARTLGVLRDTRSALWSSLGVVLGALRADDPRVADDTLWNLRVWPVDAVDWPVQNSQRLDIIVDPELPLGTTGGDSVQVLPTNERCQRRWNSNVGDLDGGSGCVEVDPGAFLLSYWAARYAGILGPPGPALQ